MTERYSRPRFATLLSGSAVGVYLLVVAGATAAIADAASACSAWPVCSSPPTLAEPALVVAWGHRVVAALVGVLVLTTAVIGLRRSTVSRRVKAALAFALALFPVQVALGAQVATTGAANPFPAVHLLTGMGIFAGLTLALAWQLEPRDADASTGDPEPEPEPTPAAEPATEPGEQPPLPDSTFARAAHVVEAYFRLMKPRLMWLLCLVASAGMALAAGAAGTELTVRTIVLTLGGGVLAIGSSGTFNHILERDRDKKMDRTSDRPIATHQLPVRNAVAFGLALAVASVAVFLQVNLLAAALGLSAILFYSVVYTLVLKPNTVQNTVIGGAAGALPALIGSAAVTGTIGLPGLMLAGVIFVWTPAHFYNLALAYKDDYERGGFPMMPVVRGEATTRKHILLWLATTLLAAAGLAALTDLGWVYAVTTTALGAVFLWAVVRLHRERDESAAFRAFHASNAYLGALLLAIVVDALVV
ncbi:heme o synthase [Halorientalis pallida]|uniref:Protoheme IX farnesyltransferase n=1 Tax=Halorientalis pallida TaxID=2479928 RepID=A0A498KVB1_9EURY|nr:heme o synthase [Halorientalis pallida]RXK49208.1 protoheme IX farnesyltransferase [Halorientalis pallida]